MIKKYTNGEVTIVWQPDACRHSTVCWKQLASVFDPQVKPWINPLGADTATLIAQVKKCPSGALTTYLNSEAQALGDPTIEVQSALEVLYPTVHHGPRKVIGDIKITNGQGMVTKEHREGIFCHCGLSKNPPYCDDTHLTLPQFQVAPSEQPT